MGGFDQIFGGGGRDIVVLRGARADYTITAEAGGGWRIVDAVGGRDGTVLIKDVEALSFTTGGTGLELAAAVAPVDDVPVALSSKIATTDLPEFLADDWMPAGARFHDAHLPALIQTTDWH